MVVVPSKFKHKLCVPLLKSMLSLVLISMLHNIFFMPPNQGITIVYIIHEFVIRCFMVPHWIKHISSVSEKGQDVNLWNDSAFCSEFMMHATMIEKNGKNDIMGWEYFSPSNIAMLIKRTQAIRQNMLNIWTIFSSVNIGYRTDYTCNKKWNFLLVEISMVICFGCTTIYCRR